MQVEIFSDASHWRGKCAGAFVIGRHRDPEGVLLPQVIKSVDAELLTTTIAIRECLKRGMVSYIVHTDLLQIDAILWLKKTPFSLNLAQLIEQCQCRIEPDAHQFAEYHLCHHRARAMVGINGTQHPWRVRELERQRKSKSVVEVELKGGLD